MKFKLLTCAAVIAVSAGMAQADGHANLVFAPGEGDFNWDSFEALKETQLNGEQVTVFGPWLGPDQEAEKASWLISPLRRARMSAIPARTASSSRLSSTPRRVQPPT